MPNCFSASSVLILLMSAIFVACFYVTFPSLTLTKLDKTTDFKRQLTAFTTVFEELPHCLQHCLQNSSRLGAMREEEDTALTSPLHGPGAGLLPEQGGMGNSSQDKDSGPAESIYWWSIYWGSSSHSVNLKALQLRNLPQKMGITTRHMGSAVQGLGPRKDGCSARLQSLKA